MAQAFVTALKESHGPENAPFQAREQARLLEPEACDWEESGEEEWARRRVNTRGNVSNVVRKLVLFLEVTDTPRRSRRDRKRKREETRALERAYKRYTDFCSPAILGAFLLIILGEDHKGGTKSAKIRARKILVDRLLSAWDFVGQRSLDLRKAMDGE